MFFSSRLAVALIALFFQYLLGMIVTVPRLFPFPVSLAGLPLIAIGMIIDVLSIRNLLGIGRGTPIPVLPPQRLVTSGPYKYVRNPLYLSFFLTLAGFTILLDLIVIIILAVALLTAIHWGVVSREEPQLEKRFGEEYMDYKRRVPRWIPRFRTFRPQSEDERSVGPRS
jgi:protein-S-isoprenylcysteine O-methyltransferase Ste14